MKSDRSKIAVLNLIHFQRFKTSLLFYKISYWDNSTFKLQNTPLILKLCLVKSDGSKIAVLNLIHFQRFKTSLLFYKISSLEIAICTKLINHIKLNYEWCILNFTFFCCIKIFVLSYYFQSFFLLYCDIYLVMLISLSYKFIIASYLISEYSLHIWRFISSIDNNYG